MVKEEVRPKKYPVEYFKRCELDLDVINKINGTIIGNDIYDQQLVYPTTNEYKTVAFSQQASLLLITLFFTPETLEKEFGINEYSDDYTEECFEKISKYRNIPVNGEVNYERVGLLIVNSIKQEKIKNITFDVL